MRRKLTHLLPVAAGVILLSILYGQLLVPGSALADRDIPGLHLPLLSDLARLAHQGVPYWNPWIHGGQPLLTNPHYAAFYPPIWIVFTVPAYYAIGLLVVLHAVWAFAGAWRLAVRWGCTSPTASLAAVAFVGGGAFASSTNLFNLYMGLAWLPWVVLWGEQALGIESNPEWKRASAKAALGLAAQILTGSPITPLLSLLALGCVGLEHLPAQWKRLFRLVPVMLTGVGAAAIQLFPTIRHIANSPRGSGLDLTMATTWSTPPIRLAEWFWPRIFGDPMLADSLLYLGYPGVDRPIPLILSIYCGGLIVALAAGGLVAPNLPYRRALAAMILVGIFLALGRHNPVYSVLLVKVPPFSLIRFPEKFLLLSTTGIALLAALTWQKLISSRQEREGRLATRASRIVAIVALSTSAVLYVAPLIAPDLAIHLLEGATADKVQWFDAGTDDSIVPAQALAARAGYLGRETFVTAVFWLGTLIVLLLASKPGIPQILLVLLALGLSIVELGYHNRTVNNTVPAALLQEPPKSLLELPPSAGRIFSDAILFGDTEFFIPDPDSEVPSSLRRFLQRLDPYSANLWGYGYALNPDPDLMLSRWGQHALGLLTSESGLMTRGWSERPYRYLGAWNAGIVVRRRSPEAQMEEKRRTGTIPEPVRLIPNPHVLAKLRFVSEVVFTSAIEEAVQQVSARDFRLADFEAVIDPARQSQDHHSTFDARVELIEVEDTGSVMEIEYQVASRAFLVVAVTADRDWLAEVDAISAPLYITALGQMAIELPAGRHRLTLKHRNPAVALGAIISLLSILGCATVLLPRRILHRD